MQERMCELEREVKEFKEKYEERKDHVCGRCGREYATPNGLNSHHKNKKCSSDKKARANRMARNARATRRGTQQSIPNEQ